MVDYSIIIPTHNSVTSIKRCINAILNSIFDKEFEIIIVDDASQDGTVDLIKKMKVNLIKNDQCLGPAKTRNIGTHFAKGEIFVFIDSDVLVNPDTLQKIDDFFTDEKEFVGLSCNLEPKCEMKDFFSRYKNLYTCFSKLDKSQSVAWAYTSTFAIKKNAFYDVGGFNESINQHEDDFIGWELVSKGYKIAFCNSLLVNHIHKHTFYSFLKERILRSRIRAIMKLTGFFLNIKLRKEPLAAKTVYGLLIFPFLIVGLCLSSVSGLFLLIPAIIFYSVSMEYLRFCKIFFGIKFMILAAFMLPLDYAFCWLGIISGVFDYIGGKRI
jgi:glycosyltransferase involved in cell wall biosynthesis